jgi:heme/copper-type cytochrome/quinol oxidase subunit 4
VTPRERWDRADWLILAGLAAVVVLVFSKVLFTRGWSFGVELDFLRQFYPARFFAAHSLAGGTFPLWNPYVLSGQPFFASYQTAMLYPFNLLMVGLYGAAGADLPLRAVSGFVVFHFWLAGVFTYLLARDIRIGRAGATVAAVTFMFSGFMTAHAGHLNQLSAAAWIPLIFLLFYRSLRGRRLSYAVGAGAAMGVALLAGHLQSVFYLGVVLAGLVVLTVIQHARGEDLPGPLFGLGALVITAVVALGLAAVQLVPTYELIGLSTRAKVPYDVAVTASLPRWQSVNLLFPHFFGASVGQYVGGWTMWETYGYCGVVGAVLGVVALLKKPRGFAIFLWVTLLVSFVLAIGPGGYLWTGLFKLGLFVNRFRDPARVLVIYGFACALLAGLGADYLVSSVSEERKERYRGAARLTGIVVGLILALALGLLVFVLVRGPRPKSANSSALLSLVTPVLLAVSLLMLLFIAGRAAGGRGRTWLSWGLVVLVAADLIVMNTLWIQVEINPNDIYGDKAASRFVAGQPGEFRVETDANTMYPSLDNGALYGLEKASGDDSLVLKEFDRFRALIVEQQAPGVQLGLFYSGGVRSELLDVSNDLYFLTRSVMDPRLAEGKFVLAGRYGNVFVYRNLTAMPRAWMSDAFAFSDNQEVYNYLRATKGAGLRETALVVDPKAVPQGSGPVPTEKDKIVAVKGEVRVVSHSALRLELSTDPSCKGLLVVSELYYPGWEVYVDGKKKEILQTDLIFRGVMLEGGQKKVEFRFRPASLRNGMVVSLVTVGLLALYSLALLVLGLLRRKKKKRLEDNEALGDSAGSQ